MLFRSGSGKSTVGAMLGKRLGRPFVDLDEEVVRTAGKPISEIFDSGGEDAFRNIESQVLRQVSARHGIVLALGGGTAVREENRYFIRQNGRVYYLQRPLESLSGEGRPLSKSPEAIRALYEERREVYQSMADVSVDCSACGTEEAAAIIAKEWQSL